MCNNCPTAVDIATGDASRARSDADKALHYVEELNRRLCRLTQVVRAMAQELGLNDLVIDKDGNIVGVRANGTQHHT